MRGSGLAFAGRAARRLSYVSASTRAFAAAGRPRQAGAPDTLRGLANPSPIACARLAACESSISSQPLRTRVIAFTLERQFLLRPAPRDRPLDVVHRLVALQAQIPTVPAVSLAARVEGPPTDRIRRALLEEKSCLRAWCLRGTVHVVRTDDFPLLHAAVMRGFVDSIVGWMRKHDGLTPRRIRANERAILRALEAGPLTRTEIRRACPGTESPTWWSRDVRHLACKGLVIHAGNRGGEAVFDLLSRWAPRASLGDCPTAEARRLLLLRYLAGYGPASPRDYAHWLGVRVRDAATAFRDAGDAVCDVGGGLFARREDLDEVEASRGKSVRDVARLLPRFDPFVLAHRDKTRWLDERHRTKVFRPAAVVEAVFLVGGRVAGTWSGGAAPGLRPFSRLAPAARRARAAAPARPAPRPPRRRPPTPLV